jgi:hypothetical protein
MAQINSRWRKGAERYSTSRTVAQTRSVRQPGGAYRQEADAPTEVRYVERMHSSDGWRNGARIMKRKTGDSK